MKTFEEAYQEAIKENGCNAGETFARSMFQAGAYNLIDQAAANGQKKFHLGMDFMKSKAIEVFKQNCINLEQGNCRQHKDCDKCTRLIRFIELLNLK